MIFRHEYTDGVWVDIEQPDENEIHQIAEEFSIEERIERELLSPTPIPIVAGGASMALLVLHFPTHGGQEGETKSQEIDFIIGKNFIVTVRYEIVAPVHHLKKLLETQALVEGKARITTDALLEILFSHLYTSMRDHANHVVESLARVEKQMFDGHEKESVRAISNISREFLHVEASLANQEDPLERFLAALSENGFFNHSFAARVQRVLAERQLTERMIKTHRAVATEMRETNNALLNAKQNEIIKILTVVSFIFLPLALIAKIFAMKIKSMPFVDDPNGFWIILGFMFFVAVLLTFFVSRKRWIS
jgi:magnesium transporter